MRNFPNVKYGQDSIWTSLSALSSAVCFISFFLTGCGAAWTTIPSTTNVVPLATPAINWVPPSVGSVNQLGTISSGVASPIILLHLTLTAVDGLPLTLAGSSWNDSGTQATLSYTYAGGTVHLKAVCANSSTGLSLTLDADKPVIASIDSGAFDPGLQLKSIVVPYYSGKVWYSQGISQFLNAWWDWQQTKATRMLGTAMQYATKTDGTLNLLHEQLRLAMSPKISDVFPGISNPPSPYRAQLAGRMVLDIWDANFAITQQGFSDLGDFGVTNCVGIVHNWQHFGYDNGLPQHYSANPTLGGSDGLLSALQAGKADGCLMAVHENYSDYYPNYPAFNQSSISLNSTGGLVNSWFNSGTNIQAYSEKPSWMVTNAKTQSDIIHAEYGTQAAFIDVNSSITPDAKPDMDASVPGAGTIGLWTTNAAALWSYERQAHAGPVFGEGDNHWFYSGLLDGVEAQLGAGQTAQNLGQTLPLFVDFDLLLIHPLQVNHGMGYYERWSLSGRGDLTTTEQDAYRMQEVAYGHAPFAGALEWNVLPQPIVESGLVTAVATSYGAAQATGIQYRVNDSWVDSSTAAKSAAFSQVQVGYTNGLSVVANASAMALDWNGLTIPQYGWAAAGDSVLAYTAQCGNTICDYSETPTTLFANSRNQADMRAGWNYASPSVSAVTQLPSSDFSMTLDWSVLRALNPAAAYVVFVHFVNDSQVTDANAGILFQDDHLPLPPTSQWQPGSIVVDGPTTVQIPSSVPDGTYSIRVGLYDPSSGARLPLEGQSDGTGRIIVGYLTISHGGSRVSFTAPPALPDDPRLNAAGSVVDFGKVKTDGLVSIRLENNQWILTPFPRNRQFTVLLSKSSFSMPKMVEISGATSTGSVLPMDQGTYWEIPLNGASSYAWTVQ